MSKKSTRIVMGFALVALVVAFCIASFKEESYSPYRLTSAIELRPNPYALPEDLDARINVPIRQVVFRWAFKPEEPELPLRSDVLVCENQVAALIDSVAAVHMDPEPNFFSGPERRLLGVSIHEPISRTSSYEVPIVDWVATYTWHRN